MPRSILSVTDLAPAELRGLFRRGEDAAGDPVELGRLLTGRLVAGLFWQPGRRVEAALRAACARSGAAYASGGDLLPGFPDVDLLEAAEAAGAYADLLVVRHPLEGAARAAAAVAGIPVLNAGDGAREDPLRGIMALRGLVARLGEKPPRSAAVCGDLRCNRLSHSLAAGLSSLGTTVLLVPARGAEMPDHTIARIAGRLGHRPLRYAAQSLKSILDMVDTVVLDPDEPYQHPLFAGLPEAGEEDLRRGKAAVEALDALFVAAPRGEDGGPVPVPPGGSHGHPWIREEGRFVFRPFGRSAGESGERPGELRGEALRDVPLLAEILRLALGPEAGPGEGETVGGREGIRCASLRCAARRIAAVEPRFTVARRDPLHLECVHCGVVVRPRWGGSRAERRYHPLHSAELRKVLPENMVWFATRQEAEQAGFRRAHPGKGPVPPDAGAAADGGAGGEAGGAREEEA